MFARPHQEPLELNDRRFVGEPLELARQLELVAERTGSLDAVTDGLEAWLRERTRPTPSAP